MAGIARWRTRVLDWILIPPETQPGKNIAGWHVTQEQGTVEPVIFLDWSEVDLALNPLHPATISFKSKSSLELQCIYILNIERLDVNI